VQNPRQVGGKVALRFTAFDFLKGFFKDVEGKVSPVGNLAAGTMAGAIEAVVWTCPTERVKVLQQNNAGRDARFNTTIGTVRAVIAQGGVASLWVGTIPSMLKQSASVGTRFWLYNLVRERIVKPGETPAHWQTMLSGAAVVSFSLLTIYDCLLCNLPRSSCENARNPAVLLCHFHEMAGRGFYDSESPV